MAGCRAPRQIQTSDYAGVLNQMARAAPGPEAVVQALPPVAPDLEGPQPVDVYIGYALSQNPEIEAARKRVDAAAYRVPQAASLDDPTLELMGFPFYPAVPQTAAGRVTTRMGVSQSVPWAGTLRTRASMAEAETNAARAELAATELQVIEQVKRVYYELYYIQTATRITEENQRLLVDFLRIAESKYQTGATSQQDMLRAQVEASNLGSELIRLRQELASTQSRMTRLLHVSPDTPVRALSEIPDGRAPANLDRLYQQAVQQSPELHGQLAEVQQNRRAVELARLAYYPDFNFSVDWAAMTTAGAMAPTADGIDDVGIGVMIDVPVYRKRLAAGVRETEAETVASVREYDSLRDQTVQEVKDLFAQAVSQYDLVKLFRDDIIPKSQQTLEVSLAGYQVGDVDFLQLIDNWQQLLRFQITYHRLQAQLQQTLAALERVVGGQLPPAPSPQPAQRAPAPQSALDTLRAPAPVLAMPPFPSSQY